MSTLSSDRKTADSQKGSTIPQSETTTSEVMASTNDLFSPSLEMHMEAGDNFDFRESELVSSMMNSGTSAVYSPFFMQMSFPEKSTVDTGKAFSSSYGSDKNGGRSLLWK